MRARKNYLPKIQSKKFRHASKRSKHKQCSSEEYISSTKAFNRKFTLQASTCNELGIRAAMRAKSSKSIHAKVKQETSKSNLVPKLTRR